jgi:hypothetical protein
LFQVDDEFAFFSRALPFILTLLTPSPTPPPLPSPPLLTLVSFATKLEAKERDFPEARERLKLKGLL